MTVPRAAWVAQARSTAGSMAVALSCGVAVGWASSAVVKLRTAGVPAPFKLSTDETAWVVSLNDAGILVRSAARLNLRRFEAYPG